MVGSGLFTRHPLSDLACRGTSLIRNSALLGPSSKVLWWVLEGGRFLMSEVILCLRQGFPTKSWL